MLPYTSCVPRSQKWLTIFYLLVGSPRAYGDKLHSGRSACKFILEPSHIPQQCSTGGPLWHGKRSAKEGHLFSHSSNGLLWKERNARVFPAVARILHISMLTRSKWEAGLSLAMVFRLPHRKSQLEQIIVVDF